VQHSATHEVSIGYELEDSKFSVHCSLIIMTPSPNNYGKKLPSSEAYIEQEAQLPQRNSASAAHMEGGWG